MDKNQECVQTNKILVSYKMIPTLKTCMNL